MNDHASVSISLTVKNAAAALDFYIKAFGAKEVFKMPLPDGNLAHAEFTIGKTMVYLSCEAPDMHAFAMKEGEHSACSFTIITEDCDGAYKQAIDTGAESLTAPEDYWWGMRSSHVVDPFGFRWHIAHITEELTPEEVAERAKKFA